MRWAVLLLLLLPFVEIWVLVQVAHSIGGLDTLALLFASAFVGIWIAKHEGMRVLQEWQTAMREQRVPEAGVLDGLLVLAGGFLMIFPGFVSDFFGLLLLLPPTRRLAAALVRRWFAAKVASGSIHVSSTTFRSASVDRDSPDGETIQGRVVEEPPDKPQLPS